MLDSGDRPSKIDVAVSETFIHTLNFKYTEPLIPKFISDNNSRLYHLIGMDIPCRLGENWIMVDITGVITDLFRSVRWMKASKTIELIDALKKDDKK